VPKGSVTPRTPEVPATTYKNADGFINKVLTYFEEFFAGFKPTVNVPGFGMSYDVYYVFEYYIQNFKWIGWLFSAIKWVYGIFMSISDWFMNTIVTWIAPLFEFGLAIGELG